MSGSGTDWKLHSKGFDEELDEGEVGPRKCIKFHIFNLNILATYGLYSTTYPKVANSPAMSTVRFQQQMNKDHT